MKCENKFCVYQSQNKCRFTETEIDMNGTCAKCIYVKIDNEQLDTLKKESYNDLIYMVQEMHKKLSAEKLYSE